MSPELIAILAVGIAVAGLILNGQTQTNRRLDYSSERKLRAANGRSHRCLRAANRGSHRCLGAANIRATINQRFDRLEARLAALEQRVARLEGVLDGLREALFSARAT